MKKGTALVSADLFRLQRVLENLVGNALRYSDPPSDVLVVLDTHGDEATVAVSDRGRGIDPEDLPHIFERGFLAKTAGEAEGLGLGLYICRLIVEARGGRVWAERDLGKGSSFAFRLPVAKAAPPPEIA